MTVQQAGKEYFEKNIRYQLPDGQMSEKYGPGVLILPYLTAYDFKVEGLEGTGLEARQITTNEYHITGTPTGNVNITFCVSYRVIGDDMDMRFEYPLRISISCDPRKMWKNVVVAPDTVFPKDDTYCEFLAANAELQTKSIVAASVRGRSHAHVGSPRDDDFRLWIDPITGWEVMAVADGAGSAKFSREGSKVACERSVEVCQQKLKEAEKLEARITAYAEACKLNDDELKKTAYKNLNIEVYNLLGVAAHEANKAIIKKAENTEGTTSRDFATTLQLAVCKKVADGWFYATFWVGDGAICLYDAHKAESILLGKPDEGEFSGQTRFLTTPDIFKDFASINSRLRFGIREEFTALMLMTDGVSDPMFGPDANLTNSKKWQEFWDRLQSGFPLDGIGGVDLASRKPEVAEQLMDWLNFWAQGEHDDRTLAIIY